MPNRNHPRECPATSLHLCAAVGTGKTLFLMSLRRWLGMAQNQYFRMRKETSQVVEDQGKRVQRGAHPRRTRPSGGASIDRLAENAECLPLFFQEPSGRYDLDIIALAGEEPLEQIRAKNVEDLPELAACYTPETGRIMAIMVHPGLTRPEHAREWFKAGIADLCEIYDTHGESTHPIPKEMAGTVTVLRSAIETAAWAHFGIPAYAPPKLDNVAQAPRTLHHWDPLCEGVFLNLPADARLVRTPKGDFELVSSELDSIQCAKIFKAINDIADDVCAGHLADLGFFRTLAENAASLLLLLTRMDVPKQLHLDVNQLRHDCKEYFAKEIGRYQTVELHHVSIRYQEDFRKAACAHLLATPDENHSSRIDHPEVEQARSCENFLKAVDRLIVQQNQEIAVSQPDKTQLVTNVPPTADRVAEASFRAARETPFVLALCLLVAWFHSQWEWIWLFLLAGVCLVGIHWLYMVFQSLSTPSWQVVGSVQDPNLRVTASPIHDVAVGDISVHESFISALFGVGWIEHKGTQVRIAGLRRFQQLTGLQVDGTPVKLWLDSAQVLMWTASFLVVVGHLVKSL